MLRDGLDTGDTARFPEKVFGEVRNGRNLGRCLAVLASLRNSSRFPPANDAPTAKGCGCARKGPTGLNDACYDVWPGNYNMFLEQLEPLSTSVGVWRAGPPTEIFGRYGRVAAKGTMSFAVRGGVFTTSAARAGAAAAYARVVFLDDVPGGAWRLAHSSKGGCTQSAAVVGTGSGHWVEARFELKRAALGAGACPNCADVVLTQQGSAEGGRPTVFNLVEVSKTPFNFELSPWQLQV